MSQKKVTTHGGSRHNAGKPPQGNHILRKCWIVPCGYLSDDQLRELKEQTQWVEELNRNLYRQAHPKKK